MKEIVPPPELCRKTCIEDFAESAFVYDNGVVVPRKERVNGPGVFPAPAASEILDALAAFTESPSVTYRNNRDWIAACSIAPWPYHIIEVIDRSPEKALLRLYFQAKDFVK